MFLAASTLLVLSTRAFVGFDRIRVKAVQSPVAARGGAIRIERDDLSTFARLNQPTALIAHLTNPDGKAGTIAIAVDGTPVCRAELPAAGARRVDCRVTVWGASDRHVVDFTGPDTGWGLTYLEVATHHGNTGGAIFVVILPYGSSHYQPLSLGFSAVTAAAFALLFLFVPPASFPRWALRLHVALAAIGVATLAAVEVSPWFSSYQVIVSTWTVLLMLAVICLPNVWTALRWLIRGEAAQGVGIRLARAATVGAGVLSIAWMVVDARLHESHHGNYSGFLTISRQQFDNNPLVNTRDDIRQGLTLLDEVGYDGQFMYFVAFDPLMRAFQNEPAQYRFVVDAVPYRYGRIGFSALTHLIAGTRWQSYPATMMWIVLLSMASAATLLALLAQSAGVTPLAGAVVLLIPGFWRSLHAVLPEPLAAATLVAGALALSSNRPALAAVLFAASLLVRETGAIFVTAVAAGLAFSGRQRQAVTLWLLAIAPVVLWRIYVGWTIFPDWGIQGFLDRPNEFDWPLRGMLRLWRVIGEGAYFPGSPSAARAGTWYSALLIGSTFVAGSLAWNVPGSSTFAAIAYAVAAVSLNYRRSWADVGNSERVTYELFVALAISTTDVRRYPRWLRIMLVALWIATGAYTIYASYDADFLRHVLNLS
jgi:hypothetical protein